MSFLNYQQGYQPQPNPYMQNNYPQSFAPSMMPQQSMPPHTQNSSINWVQGEIGARAYPVGAGSSVLLMDSEGQNFYIKSADTSGMPTLKKYAYSEVVEEPLKLESKDPANFDTAHLASRDEVKQLQEKIKELENQISSMSNKQNNNKQGGHNNG